MIVEHLKETIDWVLGRERELQIQELMVEFSNAIANLSSSPQNEAYQQTVSQTLKSLLSPLEEFENTHRAYDLSHMTEIGADKYFSADVIEEFRSILSANFMTPAIAYSEVKSFTERRGSFLRTIEAMSNGLELIGVKAYQAEEGKAELGFKLPRSYFNDDLNGLIKKLHGTKYLIETISEIEDGSPCEIKIKSISTSDPIFYLEVAHQVAISVAATFTWALATWKQIEDIRKVRAETAKLKGFTAKDLEIFDNKIQGSIKARVEEEVERRLGANPVGRQAELALKFGHSLEAVMAMIERGVTLELRYTPSEEEAHSDEQKEMSKEAMFIERELRFPAVPPDPILQIPKLFDGEEK